MMQQEKAQLRRELRAVRQAISPVEAASQAEAATRQVMAWPLYKQAYSVMLYASMPEEPSTRALCLDALAAGKALLLPHIEDRRTMTARRVSSLDTLVPGPMGILEPTMHAPVCPPDTIDLVLCPGLAFDAWGWRLGFGAGYYDRFLAGSSAVPAGFCYLQQRIAQVPHQPQDIPMEYLITAQGIMARQEEAPTA